MLVRQMSDGRLAIADFPLNHTGRLPKGAIVKFSHLVRALDGYAYGFDIGKVRFTKDFLGKRIRLIVEVIEDVEISENDNKEGV